MIRIGSREKVVFHRYIYIYIYIWAITMEIWVLAIQAS